MTYRANIDGQDVIVEAGITFTEEEYFHSYNWHNEVWCETCGLQAAAYELDMGECEACAQSRWERICAEEEATFDFGIDNHLEAAYEDQFAGVDI